MSQSFIVKNTHFIHYVLCMLINEYKIGYTDVTLLTQTKHC